MSYIKSPRLVNSASAQQCAPDRFHLIAPSSPPSRRQDTTAPDQGSLSTGYSTSFLILAIGPNMHTRIDLKSTSSLDLPPLSNILAICKRSNTPTYILCINPLKVTLSLAQDSSIVDSKATRKRKRTSSQSKSESIRSQTSSHKQLPTGKPPAKVSSPRISASEDLMQYAIDKNKPVIQSTHYSRKSDQLLVLLFFEGASNLEDTMRLASNRSKAIVESTYYSCKVDQFLSLLLLELSQAGIRCTVLSKHDTISASRPDLNTGFVIFEPRHPSGGEIKSIPHHIPYNGNAARTPGPIFDSSDINEAVFSLKGLGRRLRDANPVAFTSLSGAKACPTQSYHQPSAVLTHIIWPRKLKDTNSEHDGRKIPTGYKDDRMRIADFSAPYLNKIYSVAHDIATAAGDEETMKTYYKMHYDSLRNALDKLEDAKIEVRRLVRERDNRCRMLLAQRQVNEKRHLTGLTRLKMVRSASNQNKNEGASDRKKLEQRVSQYEKANKAYEKMESHYAPFRKRAAMRDLADLLEKWETNWISMGGTPLGTVEYLKKGTMKPLRWAAEQRGWTGLVPGDVREEKVTFISIDGKFRKALGTEHGWSTSVLYREHNRGRRALVKRR